MTDEEFYATYKFICTGPGLVQIYNTYTNKAASPIYSNQAAARYYVEQELKREMDEEIENILGDNKYVGT